MVLEAPVQDEADLEPWASLRQHSAEHVHSQTGYILARKQKRKQTGQGPTGLFKPYLSNLRSAHRHRGQKAHSIPQCCHPEE